MVVGIFGGYFWEKARDSLRPEISIHSTETPLKLVGAPGEEVGFYLTRGGVIGDRWDTAGLILTLDGKGGLVVPEHREDWGEALSYTSNSETEIKITGSFLVPQVDPGQTLTGRITGSVKSPVPSSGGKFSNSTVSARVPVELEVLSSADYAAYAKEKRGLAGLIYPVLLGIGASLLAGGFYLFLDRFSSKESRSLEKLLVPAFCVS